MKRVLLPLVLISALAFGVGNAGGRTLATTTVTVQVIGMGLVTSSPEGVSCGDGRKTCYLTFTSSGTITLTAHESAPDWSFDGWAGGGCSGSGTCALPSGADATVTASFGGPGTTTSTLSVSAITGAAAFPLSLTVTGEGTVTGGGLTCGTGGSNCSANQTAGSTVTLTATADTGQSFTPGWAGDCSGTSTTCSVTMDAAKNVTAVFDGAGTTVGPGTVPAAVLGGGNVEGGTIDCGSGGTTCTAAVPTGSTLTVVETPDAGFVFNGWSGTCIDTNKACTVELTESKALGASWSESSSNTSKVLTATVSGSGTVEGGGMDCTGPATCSRPIPAGTTVTLFAAPSEGYAFSGWTGTGSCTGIAPTCTLTMDVDRSVTATFTTAVPLTVTVGGNGSVTGGTGTINCGNGATVCSATFAQNATVSLIATPTTGATFAGWSGACGGTTTTCTVAMSAAKSVSATFTGGTPGGTTGPTLTVTVTGNGTITGGGINCGAGGNVCSSSSNGANSTVSLTATPTGGAIFGGWGGACTGTTTRCTVVMSSAKSVTATFLGGTASLQLTVSVRGAGKVTGGGITCGSGVSTCSAGETAGSKVTLTATPTSGATFTSWGGACSGTARTCIVTMSVAKSVTATFGGAGTPGTLSLVVSGGGKVSTSSGSCWATGAQKTCVQHLKAGAKVTLTATPLAGGSFLGWSGDCSGAKPACTVTLSTAKSAAARFSGGSSAPRSTKAALKSLGSPIVARSGGRFRVTLRLTTTAAGLARVRGLRAGRVAASLSLRVAAGRATLGPFPVAKSGLYTFEVRLSGRTIRWRTCLGLCGAAARAGPFRLTREAPTVTRTGDVWSVLLHCRANQISAVRIRVSRGGKALVNQGFLGRATRINVGPFLLGPGSYTLKLTAVDPYGRVRAFTWIVALAA